MSYPVPVTGLVVVYIIPFCSGPFYYGGGVGEGGIVSFLFFFFLQ